MELDVNGTIIAQPAADDIARALDAPSFPPDWYIALDNEAGASLDAQAQADGTFTLSYGDDKRRKPETVDAAAVKAVYLAFLAGAAGAQHDGQAPSAPRPKFVPDRRPLRGRSGDRPPLPAIIVIVVITALAWLPFAIERWSPGTVAAYIPYAKHDLFWVGLIFFPMLALLVVASVTKLVQFRAAKNWVQTSGRILSAGTDVRHHQFAGEPETVTNVPAVRYEFSAGARKVIGSRIGIGDDSGGANLEATLERYPVGADVTVYYDAADPTQCVLERDGLQGITKGELFGGCVSGLAILALFGATIYWLFTRGPDFIRAHFPKAGPNPQPAILSFCFGLGALLIFLAARRYAKQAANWPSVRGKIVASRVSRTRNASTNAGPRSTGRWSNMPTRCTASSCTATRSSR